MREMPCRHSVALVALMLISGSAFASDPEIRRLQIQVEELRQQMADMQRAAPTNSESGDESAAGKANEAARFVAVGSDTSGKVSWKEGLFFESSNKDFRVHVGGRVHSDWAWFAPDQNMNPRGWNDGAFFRRARLRVDGAAWEIVNFQAEIDFAPATPRVTDTFMEITQLPWLGNVRAGHFFEPFGLENWGTSDNWISFMERAPVVDALDPERNMGIILHNTAFDEGMFWAVGMFRPNSVESGASEDSGDGEYACTSRITFNPIYEAGGRRWLHLGGAYSYRSVIPIATGAFNNAAGDDPRFRSRIPLRTRGASFVNAERVVDTGTILADNIHLFNLQAALVSGPFSLQSEVIAAQVNDQVRGPQLRNPSFWGCYVFASYFLTGEHRPYVRRIGAIGMPVPHEPFFLVNRNEAGHIRPILGRGAWELLVRYGYLDLTDPGIAQIGVGPGAIPSNSVFQGRLQDVTLGVTCYLNPTCRVMWNYVYAHIDGSDSSPTTRSGNVHAFGMRFAFFF